MSLAPELMCHSVQFMDYLTLKSFSKLHKTCFIEVQRALQRQAAEIRDKFKDNADFTAFLDTSDQTLVEQVYHLNDYANGSTNDISVEKVIDGKEKFIKAPLWKYRKVNSITLGLSPEIERPQIWYLKHNYEDHLYHRYDGPAIYDGNEISYYQQAQPHRVDGPAELFYLMDMDGGFELQHEHWYLNGQLHRIDGPASIEYSLPMRDRVVQKWYLNGVLHRNIEEGPAYISYNKRADENGSIGRLKYYVNGVLIREQELKELPEDQRISLLAPAWPVVDPLYPLFGTAFFDRLSWQ